MFQPKHREEQKLKKQMLKKLKLYSLMQKHQQNYYKNKQVSISVDFEIKLFKFIT